MKKIEKLEYRTVMSGEFEGANEAATIWDIHNKVNALVDAHNELLETHTVKEPEEIKVKKIELKAISEFGPLDIHVKNPSTMKNTCCGTQNGESWGHSGPCWNPEVTPPSNSEKEEVKEQPTTVKEAFNCEMCPKEPHDHGDDRNIYLRPTTPETKVKISCPDCPHEETDTPEKKPSERIKELEKRLKKDQPNPMDDLVKYSIYCANMKVRAVINYLDELHSKGKL